MPRRVVAGTLLTVSIADPLTWIGVSGLLAAISLLALIPARRATPIGATATMRCEQTGDSSAAARLDDPLH